MGGHYPSDEPVIVPSPPSGDRWNRKSFDADGIQFGFDATTVSTAAACLRKYYYMMILNLRKEGSKADLIFGGAYAKALERFYKLRALGNSIDDALEEVVRLALIETFQYNEDGTPIGPVPFIHNTKSRMTLIRTIVWYVDQFAEESPNGITTYHLTDGTPAVELSFALELSDGIIYSGHLDRVVSYGGGLYWMDQKTTGATITPSFWDRFKPDWQFGGYTFAGRMILNSPIRGGIVDAAQIAVGFSRFERHQIMFTEDELEEWKDATLGVISQVRDATRRNKFPPNFSSCGNYGGCPFRELCGRSPAFRERFIKGSYTHPESAWDPLESR